MWLSYGLSGGGYPDVGYPMGCPGGFSGWGLSGRLSGRVIRMSVIRAVYPGVGYPGTRRFSVGGPPATFFRSRLSEEVTLSGA